MTRTPRPVWCGQCHEDTRCIELEDGGVARCPRCHASAAPGGRHDPSAAKARRRARRPEPDVENCPACGERIYRSHRCKATALDPRSLVHAASIREVRIVAGGEA